MSLALSHPWVLWALPLALLPALFTARKAVAYSSIALLPADRLSACVEICVRGTGMAAIAALVICLGGPHHPAHPEERIGKGAQMVLLLDRSRSMDQPFYSPGERIYNTIALSSAKSKARLAHRLVSEFVARRSDDMFGLILFSTYPIEVLPLTRKQEAVQAAIRAGSVGRGLAETDLGAGLEAALQFFENRRFVGSRIIMLISDGAAELDLDARNRISSLMQRDRVTLYWIYIRTRNSPGIFEPLQTVSADVTPQRALHRFFSELGVPYRAYTAENPEDLERAIADVGRLQNLPIRYVEQVPKRDLTSWFAGAAAALLALLILVRLLEVRVWR